MKIDIYTKSNGVGVEFSNIMAQVRLDMLNLEQERKEYFKNKYGFVYHANPDGWVNKCKQKEHNSFEGHLIKYPDNLIPNIGALICVGWISDKYSVDFYIYKVTKVKKSFLGMGLSTIYGEEYGYERL